MNTQFKRGILELCVLKELLDKDMYGYEIINQISEHLDVNENTVYPILRRLTKDGFFETYLKESNQGAARKYYKVTKEGFKYYINLRNEWDSFIGGVYTILNKGGQNETRIFEKFED